jgi:hypothetical protein
MQETLPRASDALPPAVGMATPGQSEPAAAVSGSANHSSLRFASGGPCDRGIPCPRLTGQVGRGRVKRGAPLDACDRFGCRLAQRRQSVIYIVQLPEDCALALRIAVPVYGLLTRFSEP